VSAGAGKTTTINMLTGVLPATSGSALVYGNNIVDAGGMGRVRSFMGVCPQFDILWGDLTGREHLWLFANIRGLPRQQVATVGLPLLLQPGYLPPA
jgi:ABC-type multidrug transport system ATPase subunit